MGTQLVEYISGASFGGRLEARPWLGRASHGPTTEVLRAPAVGHGGLRAPAAGGAATERWRPAAQPWRREELGPIKTEITK